MKIIILPIGVIRGATKETTTEDNTSCTAKRMKT